jgi:methionine--tRNA ligase beta chain
MSEPTVPAQPPIIKYDDFAKLDLRIATIIEATPHPDPKVDKLLVLKVSIGTEERQIVAGIKAHYPPEQLAGKQILVVCNLESRALRGVTSHGMLLAASNDKGEFALLSPDKAITPGSSVK